MRILIAISIFFFFITVGFAQEPRFSWNRIGPDGGNISCFIEVDSVLLVGTPGGMFRSLDYGNSWQLIEQGLPNTPFSLSNFTYSQGTIFAAVGSSRSDFAGLDLGSRLFASTNHGESWHAVHPNNRINNEGYNTINLLEAMDSTLILSVFLDIGGGRDVRTWRSLDKGTTWTSVSGIPTSLFSSAPQTPQKGNKIIRVGNILLFSSRLGVFRSEDNGGIWQFNQLTSSLDYGLRSSLLRSGNNLFLGLDSLIYVSRDTGKSWQTTGFVMPRFSSQEQFFVADMILVRDTLMAAICPNYDANRGDYFKSTYLPPLNQSVGTIMVSGDNGRTWQMRNSAVQAIPYSAPLFIAQTKGGLFFVGADNSQSATFQQNGLWRSTDQGQTWQKVDRGIAGYFPRLFVPIRNQIYAFTDLGRCFRLEAGSFQRVYPDSTFNDYTYITGNIFALDTVLYGINIFKQKKSINGSKTWSTIEQSRNPDTSFVFPYQVMTLQSPNGIVAVGISQKGWIRSIDTGRTWSIIPSIQKKTRIVRNSFE